MILEVFSNLRDSVWSGQRSSVPTRAAASPSLGPSVAARVLVGLDGAAARDWQLPSPTRPPFPPRSVKLGSSEGYRIQATKEGHHNPDGATLLLAGTAAGHNTAHPSGGDAHTGAAPTQERVSIPPALRGTDGLQRTERGWTAMRVPPCLPRGPGYTALRQ